MVTSRETQHQRLYREVNKHILAVSSSFELDDTLEFLCECGDSDCHLVVELSKDEAERMLSDQAGLLVGTFHAAALDGRRVVTSSERFILVARG